METWVVVSVVIAAVAIVFQATMLTMMFVQMRKTVERVDKLTSDLHSRVGPIITRVQLLLDDTQPKITEMVADAAHVVYLARGQAQKLDRVVSEATDRLRGQLVTADRILTGTLETVEEAGSQFKRGVWKPMQKASAIISGVKVGLDFLRSRRSGRRRSPEDADIEDGEELFI
ncbi:MAG TPA: hypothetical protein VH022_10110 [Candidatus Acidoferrum sp.]|jgi:hypothetical protein|nr:hypothetical protein [Candidatus Acidoferrum sp.]